MADVNGFFTQLLRQGGYPVTPANLQALAAWQKAEGGWTNNRAAFNPLNTTHGSYPAMNSVGVRIYPNLQTGVKATLDTLNLPYYRGIRSLLKSGNPNIDQFAQAVYTSPWGTKRGIGSGGGYGAGAASYSAPLPVGAPKVVPPQVLKMIGLNPKDVPKPGQLPKSLMAALPPGVPRMIPHSGGLLYPRLSGTASSAAGQRIVSEAYHWLGTPYSWAGGGLAGPSKGVGKGANTVGFDCSSFLQYVWNKAAGVKIPRTTYQQWKTGFDPKSALKPGDAVFFHMGPNGPEHVGMYIGNDEFIHAPHTGDVVKISRLSTYGGFVGARRYA